MDFTPRMQKYIDDRLVEAGAQWNRPFSWPHIQMVAICDSASPEAFHGEVRMAGKPSSSLRRPTTLARHSGTPSRPSPQG
jgi:hypothetical protein